MLSWIICRGNDQNNENVDSEASVSTCKGTGHLPNKSQRLYRLAGVLRPVLFPSLPIAVNLVLRFCAKSQASFNSNITTQKLLSR